VDAGRKEKRKRINLGGTITTPTLLSQSLTFTLPRYPVVASSHASTTLKPIGIGRNGVCYVNQYNGQMAVLDDLEINNVDQYLGHPTPSFEFLHTESMLLIDKKSRIRGIYYATQKVDIERVSDDIRTLLKE